MGSAGIGPAFVVRPIDVRVMTQDDVTAADLVAWSSLRAMAVSYEGVALPERDDARVARARHRIAHLQRTDPDGAWVAVDGEQIVGVALALRRGPMWFLSLLAVATERQAQGIGRALLDAALQTSRGAGAAWILSSSDPKAVRRYALAGFAPTPAYAAAGPLDRALIPGGLGVREGDLAEDAALVDNVATVLRGAGYGPDLAAMGRVGSRLQLVDDGEGRGFAVTGPHGVTALGASTPVVAQRLLWDALGRWEGAEVSLDWLTGTQQWAIDVALAARLGLRHGASVCVRSALGPLSPFLPGGAYG